MKLAFHLRTLLIGALLAFAALAPLPAQSGALTDYAENKLIDALLRGQAIGTPATWYVALFTTTCTDAGPGTEVSTSGTAYGRQAVTASLWQLSLCRLDADSFDDQGALGRPFLDASRDVWRKLRMTEEDLVIRRRHRAPLRMAHVLEGATGDELQTYQDRVEAEKGQITTDFYMNRKGGVSAVQGDAALGEIGDVVHLLDTFFSGSPFPKGLMGYTDGMARDILEDLKRDYYEEVDSFQDTLAFAYEFGFRLHLLLKGIVLDPVENVIGFGERKTETPNQLTDRLLKWMALGMPRDMIFEEMGYNAQAIQERLDEQAKRGDPYPGGVDLPGGGMPGGVKITPGNARKGESGTSIANRAG